MISNRFRIFCALSAVFLAASACAIPLNAPSTPTPQMPTAPALVASATASAEPTTPAPPTQTEEPTATIALTETVTETATLQVGVFPTETPTPTLEPIFAAVMKETSCLAGPGGHYQKLATYQIGARLQVIARDLGGGFIFVQNPEKPDEQCYILANNVKLTGDVSILPQFTPPPSPTASPNFSATFKKFDLCGGDVYALFTIVNTGSVPLRSAYVKVTNLRNNDTAEWTLNAFDLYTGCIIAKNIAPLNPGASGYLRSDVFKRDPRGSKLRAVIQVCTEKNIKGTCPTIVIEIKP